MRTMPIEQVEGHLAEIIETLPPGEVIIARDEKLLARLVGERGERPRPLPGRGKGMLTIISDDEEYMP